MVNYRITECRRCGMKAYLVYYPDEAQKNKGFIELFREAGREFGIDFLYVPYSEYRQRGLPGLVLNRTRNAAVSRWYEERGIRVLHSSKITAIGNDKMKTLEFLRERLPQEILNKKWCPETVLIPKERIAEWYQAAEQEEYEGLTELLPYMDRGEAFVLKSVSGHGGSEVFQCTLHRHSGDGEKRQGWTGFLTALRHLKGKNCILQEMIPCLSRDIRVYILGNRIYQGILRQGQTDFRSNFSLGGRTQVYRFTEEEEIFIDAFVQAFTEEGLGLAGLDFMLAEDGRLIFNELEEMAGCRMLYRNTSLDVVRDYVRWLTMEK